MGKTRNLQKRFKIALVAIAMLSMGAVSAQRTVSTSNTTDFGKETNTVLGSEGGSIRVIDNKGTKKYLQAKNGVTILTDITPNGGIVSTWQLGGTLTDATNISTGEQEFKITIDKGDGTTTSDGSFIIDGLEFETGDAAVDDAATSGYTLLVRDENTGETKKMLATDLIQSGHKKTYGTSATITLGVTLPSFEQVYVYRNGAKLVANTDYKIATNNTDITLLPQTNNDDEDWALYATDVIEVHFIK